MKSVIVQLGNAMDTSGASIEFGVLFHTREHMFGTTHFIVTRKGIAMAEEMKFGWFYSTACLPLSYAASIETEWEINIPNEYDEMLAVCKTLEHGIKSSAILSSTVVNYAVRHLAEQSLYSEDKAEASQKLRTLRSFLVEKHGHEKASTILTAVLNKAFNEPRIAANLGYEPVEATVVEPLLTNA